VTVPLAEPLTDANGNIVLDLKGARHRVIQRLMRRELYMEQIGEKKIDRVLCHQPHMSPVAVCRLCIVQIYGQKGPSGGGAKTAARVPAPSEGGWKFYHKRLDPMAIECDRQ
jgi:hypothetical protein